MAGVLEMSQEVSEGETSFSPLLTALLTPRVCSFPLTPNSADTNNLELVQTPQAKASVLQDCPLPTSDASYKSQAVTCPSD